MEEQREESRQVGRDKGFYDVTNSSMNNKDQGNKSMSEQRSFMSQQQQHATVRNSVATWENIVVTKVEKNHRKNFATQ